MSIQTVLETHCPTVVSSTIINKYNNRHENCCYESAVHMWNNTSSVSAISSDGNTKGNDGSSPYMRQKRICRVLLWVLLAVGSYQLLVAHFLAGLVPDIEIDPETGRKRYRRRPDRNKKLDANGKVIPRSPIDGVVEGHLHLIDIQIPDDDTIFSSSQYNVKGVFCALEWGKQQEDPSRVPLFDDLARESSLCAVTRHTADLFQVTQSARKWDLHFRNTTLTKRIEKRKQKKHIPQPDAEPIERSIPPTALIFHESRCGSTLVSNVLSSFAPDGSSRVYSEAPAPLKALEACSTTAITTASPNDEKEQEESSNDNNDQQARLNRSKKCQENPGMQQQLIRDVFYMMGRTQLRGPEHNYVFYKLQAKAVHYIDLLEHSFGPDNMPPWMYLYRDNVNVMQSHLGGSVVDPASEERNVLGQKKTPKCLEGFGSKEPPSPSLQEVVTVQMRTVESLTREEYCAAQLASLSESAIQHYTHQLESTERQRNVPHFFVNYKQLPDIIWDHVLPNLGIDLAAKDVHRMEKVAAMYTQGRTGTKKKGLAVFGGDSEHKEANAPFPVAQAAQLFMDQTFEKLEALADTTLKAPMEKGDNEP